MPKKLALRTFFLDTGKTFAIASVRGARMRVVDGLVWATTTGSIDDVWLRAGQEHRIENRGLTVIESAARSIVELMPPPAAQGQFLTRSKVMNDYVPSIPRAVFVAAACTMSALTLSLTVIAPAQIEPARQETRLAAVAPNAITPSRNVRLAPQAAAQDSNTRCVL